MERSKKKHQDIPPLTNEEIALQKQLLMLAGGRGVGRNQILNKDAIANLLVHLDPVRMYYITDRDFSHTLARYNTDLQNLWEKIANLWWKEYNTSVTIEEIIEQLKAIGVKTIDYYRLILCNWMLQKTFKTMVEYDLYFRESPIGRLQIYENSDKSMILSLVELPGSSGLHPKIISKFDKMVKILPNFRKVDSVVSPQKGKATTRVSGFCFLYKILSIKGLWIEIELEKTAKQYFKDPEKLETYKTILLNYRSKMQEIDKERKQWVDLYNFRILDDRLVLYDEILNLLEKRGFYSLRLWHGYSIFISKNDLTFKMFCAKRNDLLDQIVSHFFGMLPHPNRSEYEFDIPTFEQQVIIFYILLSNSYTDTHSEHDKKYLVREKINTPF